ncbi:uncharacterized protein [Diabrotica undecimpunctata]|uniref:uncharacterized protein isoform X2 n=1 Tax=Diabrotica undecimpunctata TaxID=50387 RepID=UPI003B6372D0
MIPKDICDLLEESLDEKIENFEIQELEGNQRGQGYLGEMVFFSLKNKNTGEDHNLVVKQCLVGSEKTSKFMSMCFNNEVHFYTKVIPALQAFQKSYPKVEIFNNIPKCFATSSKKGKEKLVMENLKLKDYKMHPKKIPLNSQMYEIIFKTYGKFHGISYAFKHYHPEQFSELGAGYHKNMKTFFNRDIEDIKMFDFQMAGVGSPILDLTYSFYSGADEESISNLDHFLEIYYKSLSETLKDYGCSAEKVLPFTELKKEWKEHNAFGVLLGLLIWNFKYLEQSEDPNMAELLDTDSQGENFSQILQKADSTGFKSASLAIMRHLYKNNFLH